MGEAKRRGTYEQRRAAAVKNQEECKAVIAERVAEMRSRRGKINKSNFIAMAAAAGMTIVDDPEDPDGELQDM